MTRINILHPSYLIDQHLLAEWRELPRVVNTVRARLEAGETFEEICLLLPETYRMGTGHVRFFYNKIAWLCTRHRLLTAELLDRGYDLTERPALEPPLGAEGVEWAPDLDAVQANLWRLRESADRMARVPTHRRRATPEWYMNLMPSEMRLLAPRRADVDLETAAAHRLTTPGRTP